MGTWRKLSRGVSKKIQHLDGPRRSTIESSQRLRAMMVQEGARQKEK